MRIPTGLLLLSLAFWGCMSEDIKSEKSGPPNILFLIADDWSYPHAGVYGDPIVQTPTFDKLAGEGALFTNAFCAAPSCSPSRAAILTSRYPHQLESAGNLWSVIPVKFSNWMSVLEENGYLTGKIGKGWGPGDFERGGYVNNPAGKDYPSFESFLNERKPGQLFSFWFGSMDPHREYEANTGAKTGMVINEVPVPDFLPDLECVRNDLMDYYFEVERFDRECENIIRQLKEAGELENTLIIMTSDNGMPFPRAKANLYDYGTRMPLVMYWKGRIKAGTKIEDFMNFVDFGPTIMKAANLDIPDDFSGSSLLGLLGIYPKSGPPRDRVFLERERHANVRKGDLSYPSRALRTKDYLYIRNFEPERWPAGDPETHQSVGQFGDVDNSISKFLIMEMEGENQNQKYYEWSFSKRPDEELYILKNDPDNINNVAMIPEYQALLTGLREELNVWMEITNDLRYSQPQTIYWDTLEYTPDYQHVDFDLRKEIDEYKLLKSLAYGRFQESPCKK